MTKPTTPATTSFATLPALGESFEGGIFAGIYTRTDGTHCAIVRLPENGTQLTWKKALTWATKHGGELPTRPVAALLFANVKASLRAGWHWTSEEIDASYAWNCYFVNGLQSLSLKSYEGSAVAVRLIPLTAITPSLTNPRKTFNAERLAELANSIKALPFDKFAADPVPESDEPEHQNAVQAAYGGLVQTAG